MYLLKQAERSDYELTISLEQQVVFDDEGFTSAFDIDPYRKQLLLKGWDEIDLTFVYEPYIIAYEKARS